MVHTRTAERWFRTLAAALIAAAIALGTGLNADAAGGWWDTGKNLLKSLGQGSGQDGPAVDEIAAALKEALRIGTGDVVGRLGQLDGFNTDPSVRIPLPDNFRTVKAVLGKVGMSGMLDDLELKLNRAAEAATPRVKTLFWQAISEMTLEDARGIYKGPEDAATTYFKRKMSPALAAEMRPVVSDSLSAVGAIQSYNSIMGKYRSLPLVPDFQADLADHVVERGLDGIFHYLALEESAIRQDPAKRTTDLLKRVFGRK